MKVVKALLIAICFAIAIWFIASYVDVVTHNMTTCTYQPWNLFDILA